MVYQEKILPQDSIYQMMHYTGLKKDRQVYQENMHIYFQMSLAAI